jgi:hypothetical protein
MHEADQRKIARRGEPRMETIILLYFWVALSLAIGGVASSRGLDGGFLPWAMMALLLSPLVMGVLAFGIHPHTARRVQTVEGAQQFGVHRECPECLEPVKVEARRCRHCGSSLIPTLNQTVSAR